MDSASRPRFYPERIFFTFPDGVFSYECRGCGACCKGLGIGLDAARGEVERLVERYPGVEGFMRRRGETWTAFNPRGACWFLEEDGWCRVEREHGRASKPAVCRLFPFNRVFWMGTWAVVDFNSVICPLRAPPPEASEEEIGLSGRVRHAEVLEELESVADPAVIGTQLPVEQGNATGRAFHARESAIAEVCFAGRPVQDALLAQVGAEEGAAALTREVTGALQALLGRPWEAPGEETTRRALLLTPSMRFNELFGPRQLAPYDTMVELLPGLWLVWLHLLAQGERLAQRPLTLQEATSVWAEAAPLGYVAARWAAIPEMDPGPIELMATGDARRRLLELGSACCANTSGETLGALVARAVDGLSPLERVALVREADPLWAKARWRRAGARKASRGRRRGRRRR